MRRRLSGSADDDFESSLESEPAIDQTPSSSDTLSAPNRRSSMTRGKDKLSTSLNWKHGNGHVNGLAADGSKAMTKAASLPPLSLTRSRSDSRLAATTKHLPTAPARVTRSLWSMPIFSLLIAALGIAALCAISNSLVTRQLDPKGCRMSYMRPSYLRFTEFDTEHTRFATKYSLYLYREQGIDDENQLRGIPVLFIPGNAGSYKQVRPIAAEAATYFHDVVQFDGRRVDAGVRNLDFFSVDFNEDITAFHGQTLLDQAEYLNEAIRYILSLYSDPRRGSRSPILPDPTSVIVLGHSMGGIVARTMLVQPNYQANSINTIITMSAPHARPPVTFDGQIVQIYDEINEYWRNAYAQKWANNNPLWQVTLVSIAGGSLDTIVPSDYASLETLVPETHGFTVFTSGIPSVWTSSDHQAILWCDQFRKVISRALFDIVDVHRASQTKPRAERMRAFRHRFLSGLEHNAEKSAPREAPSVQLTLGDESLRMVYSGDRLVLSGSNTESKVQAYLIPVPARESPDASWFTLLTNNQIGDTGDANRLEVLLCNMLPYQSSYSTPSLPVNIDLSTAADGSTRLACKDAAQDVVTLPASTFSSQYPFSLDSENDSQAFNFIQYELQDLAEHQFIALVDMTSSVADRFAIAEFIDAGTRQQQHVISLTELLTKGLSVSLPANHPTTFEVNIPAISSSLLSYNLDVFGGRCSPQQQLFAPMARQHLDRPYETKYFVNVEHASISLHGTAPYVPYSSQSKSNGLKFQFWVDPTCGEPVHITLHVDVYGSFGKLYMRYRTVFAAFPLLIVTLILRKQFRVYDQTGIFISFPESLDLSLKRSIPLLLISLTSLSLSPIFPVNVGDGPLAKFVEAATPFKVDFHWNDLLVGTNDPFFWFLIPLVGLICIGVCVIVHYITLLLTHILATVFTYTNTFSSTGQEDEHKRSRSPVFNPSTPRRRMITTAALLFLVSTFIPYQFAYLVACLVQVLTVVRALRIRDAVGSATNSNYYHYAHSILVLMLWALPINLPILAVWIRNLAVHWLTPFSSHHNVLSIMPFILLVENLTTGKMVPQLTSSLRHITSILLFATAVFAAMYGVSHAYILHYLVNIIAAWLVAVHSTAEPWSFAALGAMFHGSARETRQREEAS
jgi:glycosylphosphatidylinositol deacylase